MAANPALVRMLGYDSEDELLEVDVARDVYMDPGHREGWITAMQENGEVRNAELVLKRRTAARSSCWRIRARSATPTTACSSTRAR